MRPIDEEIPLTGGRITAGVVRIGDTVRRPRGGNAEFASRLLKHLDGVGFKGAPRYLGVDAEGRDVLSFLPGDVPGELGWHEDEVLAAAGRLIRHYHDATASFAGRGPAEIVCHNDLSPCNFVFRAGQPAAMIDFDAAAPGGRIHDLGYAAWLWLDFGNADISPARQAARLKLFLHAYGEVDPAAVLRSTLHHQHRLAAEGHRDGKTAMAEWATACADWTRANLRRLSG